MFASGVEVEPVMDCAGLGLAEAIEQFFPGPSVALIYAGRGHNGGDALVAGRFLVEAGWDV